MHRIVELLAQGKSVAAIALWSAREGGVHVLSTVSRSRGMTNNRTISGRVNIMKQYAMDKRVVSAISGGLVSVGHI